MGDFMKQRTAGFYAVLQMQETFGLSINDISQYELALKNLEILYLQLIFSNKKNILC